MLSNCMPSPFKAQKAKVITSIRCGYLSIHSTYCFNSLSSHIHLLSWQILKPSEIEGRVSTYYYTYFLLKIFISLHFSSSLVFKCVILILELNFHNMIWFINTYSPCNYLIYVPCTCFYVKQFQR